MRKFTLDQYKRMSDKFNTLSFKQKIKVLIENRDILMLANDYNWWGVRLIDEEMQNLLEENDIVFSIHNEWDHEEMEDLISLLGIQLTHL
jgi:hypothetical protein